MEIIFYATSLSTTLIAFLGFLGKRLLDKNDEAIEELKVIQDRELTRLRQDMSSALDSANSRVDLTEESLAEMKLNYIQRFEKVYEGMNGINIAIETMKSEILKALHANTDEIRKEFVTKEICRLRGKSEHF